MTSSSVTAASICNIVDYDVNETIHKLKSTQTLQQKTINGSVLS